MAKPGESNWNILNVGYGVLNPVGDALSGKAYNPDDTGWFSMVRQVAVSQYSPASGLNNGPLVGIVLRNEGKIDLTGPVDPTSWASKYAQLMEKRDGLALMQVRVRIPEIHSHLPVPKDLPPRDTPSEDHGITNLYPVFVGQFDSVDGGREPVHGSLVWVDFQNRTTFQGPIYLGAVESSKTYLPNYALETSNKFASICNRALNESVQPAGTGTGTGKGGGSGTGTGKPIVSEDGTPKTTEKTASALENVLKAVASTTTLGKIILAGGVVVGTPTGKKAKKAVVAAAKSGANKAVKIYCKTLQRLQGDVTNIKKRFPNVPFPEGTNVCDKAAIDKLIEDHFTPGGSKYASGGMLGGTSTTGTTKAEKAANARKVYKMFTENGYTPQAALAVLSHTVFESGYDNRIAGGASNKKYPITDNRHWPDKGFYQQNATYSAGGSKKLKPEYCIDKSTGENYYDKIGGGKTAAIAPEKYAYTKNPSNPRPLAKDVKGGRGSLAEAEWEAGNYWDAGDIGAATMFQIALLRKARSSTGRLGSLDALMHNPRCNRGSNICSYEKYHFCSRRRKLHRANIDEKKNGQRCKKNGRMLYGRRIHTELSTRDNINRKRIKIIQIKCFNKYNYLFVL
jgi:hypothetical protein